MQNETQTSPELQQSAVQIELPADLLTQLEEVKAQTEILTGGNENWLDEQISRGYDTYGHDMSEFTGDLEALEKSGLEPFNFRVDSTGWAIEEASGENGGIQVKVNPEGDIFEYVSGVSQELIGEQCFTSKAARREIRKIGKTLPGKEKWKEICESYGDNGKKLSIDLGLSLMGKRTSNHYYNRGLQAYYYSDHDRPSDMPVDYLEISISSFAFDTTNSIELYSRHYFDLIFSVRCMKK